MIIHTSVYRRLALIGFVLFVLSGCAAKRIPITLDPSFCDMQIQPVALLPIVDRRVDKSYEIDLEKKIKISVKKILKKKGYSVLMPSSFTEGKVVDPTEVAEMDVDDLALLGPKEVNAVVLVYIEDIFSKYGVLSYECKIEATACMISKEKQTELWRDKGIGRSGQFGLVSGLTKGLDRKLAFIYCLEDLFSTLPKAPRY